jgi:hypothetical protein
MKRLMWLCLLAVLALSFGIASAQDPVVIQWWHINTGSTA